MANTYTRAAALLLLAIPHAAYAQEADMSVFDYRIGEPLDVPICAGYYPKEACTSGSRTAEGSWQIARIEYPPSKTPKIMSSIILKVYLMETRIAGFLFETSGVMGQDAVLRDLQDKYGPASSVTRLPLATLGGGRFEALKATWDLPDLQVEYSSTAKGIGRGVVTIYSNDLAAKVREADALKESARPEL